MLAIVALWQSHALIASGWAAQALQVATVVLMLWARWTFGRRSFHIGANPTPGGLVTSGPYRYVRHPIYAAVLYFTWAGVLTHISTTSVLLALAVTAGFAIRIVAEERSVAARYPEYRAYAARTGRVLPWIL